MTASSASRHERAAETFARQVRERHGDAVETILLYGSVARGEQRGIDSDVDLLVVLHEDVDEAELEDRVRTLAYDVELEYGVVLSLLVLPMKDYEHRSDHPFFRNVRRDAEVLYG